MLWCYSLILLGITSTTSAFVPRAACNADNCLRALRATEPSGRIAQASSDCKSLLWTTVTPLPVTITENAPVAALQQKRQASTPIPVYASRCSEISRFSSACSCIGVTSSIITAAASTVIVTYVQPAVTTTCREPDTVTETATETVSVTDMAIKTTTVFDLSTIVEAVTSTESTTITDSTTVTDSTTITESTTITDSTTVTDLATVTDTTTISEPTTITDSTTVTDSTTITELTTITEPTTLTVRQTATESTTTTTTSTTSVAACPTGNPIVNGGFESFLPGTWSILSSGDGNYERTNSAASSGSFAFRARIAATNANLPQRIIQAITICPGANYQVSFMARRATTAGNVAAALYINDTLLAGGTITASSFQPAPVVNGGIFSSTVNSVIVRMEFTYSGGTNQAKEILVDDIVLTRLS
ncbi:hypothetical protein TWF694_011291 [Orbilia ellipsospora]|uniref:CBM-cenC domain-containing protein n=1 Tax=Orbilia ellipsospora TaxID=2528407 RepID=A0AAV9X8N2_9PEZI